MESMDLAAGRKLKNLALAPFSIVGGELGAFEALLDVLESGSFTDPEMASVLQQTANVVGTSGHLRIFEGRVAQLVERAEYKPRQFMLEGPWEAVGQ
ncbi:hypothetical protein HY732_04745 [Candidatus Uhrbacteria bacterium]|nr:hypothetical protein [Candidatus Uhrbacteria bacterium]